MIHCPFSSLIVRLRPGSVLWKTCPIGLLGICLAGNFFRKTRLVILIQKHWTENVTVTRPHVMLFSDLAWYQQDCFWKSKDVSLIRDGWDLSCWQSKSQVLQMSASKSSSYCDDTFCFTLWASWAFKRLAPFEQWCISKKRSVLKKSL